ncbi:MAG: hypothetical protein JSV63_01690 [Candidatus Aenigmatarchaeota archaeon]|nr:MAG: hypothetical protein JSV63_01690 [Candidatus Aenigmarchaeota archaeon]
MRYPTWVVAWSGRAEDGSRLRYVDIFSDLDFRDILLTHGIKVFGDEALAVQPCRTKPGVQRTIKNFREEYDAPNFLGVAEYKNAVRMAQRGEYWGARELPSSYPLASDHLEPASVSPSIFSPDYFVVTSQADFASGSRRYVGTFTKKQFGDLLQFGAGIAKVLEVRPCMTSLGARKVRDRLRRDMIANQSDDYSVVGEEEFPDL